MQRRLDRFDRRMLLRFGAAGAGALAAAPLLRQAPKNALAQGRGPLSGAIQTGFKTGFSPVPAALAFGAVADSAAGWDGTLWAIDASGAPSVYDSVAGAWQLHGTGIDAVAWAGSVGAAPATSTPTPGITGTPGGTPTPAAGATSTPTPQPTVVPPPLEPTIVLPPLLPLTPQPTVEPPPLEPTASPGVASAAAQGEGRALRIVLAGAPAQQAASSPTTTIPSSTGTPAATATHTPTAAPAAPSGTPAGTASPGGTASRPPAGTPGGAFSATPTPTLTPLPGGTATPAGASATPTYTGTPGGTRVPDALADSVSGMYVFRGPQVVFLPITSLSALTTPSDVTPAATATATAERTPGLTATATPERAPEATPAAATTPASSPSGGIVPIVLRGAPAPQGGATPSPTPQPLTPLQPAATGTPAATGATATRTPAATAAGVSTSTPVATATLAATGTPSGPVGAAVPLTPGVPQLIGDLWPGLPASFKLGVRGAADVNGVLYLFKAGRYVRADGASPPARPSDLPGWPQTPAWKDGVVDVVGSSRGSTSIVLIRGGEFLVVNIGPGGPPWGPNPLSAGFGGAVLAQLQGGATEALLYDGSVMHTFAGPAVATFANSQAPQATTRAYLGQAVFGWPVTWNPVLQHAPSGRVGALWAATAAGGVVLHDGAEWTAQPGSVSSVAAGQDGSVFAAGHGGAAATLSRWDGNAWQAVATAPSPLSQVTVGDASHVWARGSDGSAQQLSGTQLNSQVLLGTVAHLAANTDGTVWSCDGARPAAFRFNSEAQGASPQTLATAGPAQKVASTGFGAAHVLVGQGEGAQLFRYDSPYLFKAPQAYSIGLGGPLESGLGHIYQDVIVQSQGSPPR